PRLLPVSRNTGSNLNGPSLQCSIRDISSKVHTFKVYPLNRPIGLLSCGLNVTSNGGNPKNPATVGHYLIICKGGACMEDNHVVHFLHIVKSRDHFALFIVARVASRRKNHTHGYLVLPANDKV